MQFKQMFDSSHLSLLLQSVAVKLGFRVYNTLIPTSGVQQGVLADLPVHWQGKELKLLKDSTGIKFFWL